ncbi:response regulator [Vibrio japonicus]|uniref:histidine kinase n=1 Tax=Vibrio japonicus TaxID=1824638 RepID=A0ABY5LLY2_9VIBR|nr:response regulator [Vibrio japonicus]UUM31788.1 ATP-binding protein [Vibrio japonicus]
MCLKIKEQLCEALIELKQSQEREARLVSENRSILDAISSITSASNKQQIFHELNKVLSLYIEFTDFIVLSKNVDEKAFRTILSSNSVFDNAGWFNSSKFERALKGESIILFEPAKLTEFSNLEQPQKAAIKSALLTGVKTTVTESIILLVGDKAGKFSLSSSETLSKFRPLIERALTDIEHKEQLQQLVEVRTQQLKQAQLKAEQANKSKSRFLAMMSHELRTPLNAVLGYIDVLSQDKKLTTQLDILEQMESSAEHLLVLINDILELSRIESGGFQVKLRWVNLHSEFTYILEHFHHLSTAKGLDFSTSIEFEKDMLFHLDPARVMQIVFNLLGNAVKFTESGSVSLKAQLVNSNLTITVQDTGIGIDESRLQAVFSQFKQADDSITRKYGGSGLGLTISKHLVELMNGEIALESSLGEGSTFSIKLPVSVKSELNEEHIANNIVNVPTSSLKILVVEDTETNQMVIKLLLEKLGHKVVMLSNGEESVDYLKENMHHVDLIFMDVSMPVMDGITATRKIRQFCTKTPIIALTAHAMDQDKQTCLDAGMNAFVSKPIRSAEIQSAIETVLIY